MVNGQLGGGIVSVIALALLTGTFHVAPHMSRPDVYFGVTVPVGFRDGPAAQAVFRRYRHHVWLHALVAAAIVLTAWRWRSPAFVAGTIGWMATTRGHDVAEGGTELPCLPQGQDAGRIRPYLRFRRE